MGYEASKTEPNNMEMWPDNVKIFHPPKDPEDVQKIKDSILETQDTQTKYNDPATGQEKMTFTSGNHFSSRHYALLFAPGEYKNCDFEVGYYVQMAGLGAAATDVKFTGECSGPFVEPLNKHLPVTEGGTIAYPGSGLSLDTFWRSAENFSTSASSGMLWSVSQAAPLRRVHIDTNLMFEGGGYASGGVLANAVVTGTTHYGGQQQWFSRNVDFKDEVEGGAWNLVFSGCTGNIPDHGIAGARSTSVHVEPKLRVEKPIITLDGNRFQLRVPVCTRDHVMGPDLEGVHADVRDFSRVKLGISNREKDDEIYNTLTSEDEKLTLELQAALDEGKDLVLCPGVFFLTRALVVKTPNQVILGLGLATVVAPQDGSPCIRVRSNIPGVHIAGIMLEASVQQISSEKQGCNTTKNADGISSLLEWGEPNVTDPGDPMNFGVMTDIFARVGGSNLDRNVSTDVMIRVHSGNVVGDNLWLWRADHVRLHEGEEPNNANFPFYHQTIEGECQVKTALEVSGDDVHMYGLFCEHCVEHQLVWSGERGEVIFYQCELPYDVSHENFGDKGYVGYKIHDDVNVHLARGVGVYSNFANEAVNVATAIEHPEKSGIVVEFPFTVLLSNEGQIQSVINGKGDPAIIPGKPTRP